MTPSSLPPTAALPAPPSRVLAITAHPDDADYFFGGTVALWSARGAHIAYVVATDGARGRVPPGLAADALGLTRRAEQIAAAAAVGVFDVDFLGFPDSELMETLDLRRALVAAIRRVRPQIVIGFDPTAWFLNGRLNHPDHRAVGAATVAACWPACANPLSFPELLDAGLPPHKPDALWLAATHEPTHSVEMGAALARKAAALACNASQIPGSETERLAACHAQLTADFGHTDADGNVTCFETFRVSCL